VYVIVLVYLFRSAPGPAIVICVLGLCAGIYGFYQGFCLLQQRRIILDTPVSKIRSASLGLVELSGLAVGPRTLIAPITARQCYYYRTLVWELKQEGKNKKWVKVASECMFVPFFLDDNTGKILIDPRGAELDLHRDFQQEFCDSFFTLKEPVPDSVRILLSRHGVNTSNRIKVEEFCIKPKNALFVLGTLAETPGLELDDQPIHDDDYNTLTFGKSLWAGSNDSEAFHFSLPLGSTAFSSEELSMGQRLFGGVSRREAVQQNSTDQSSLHETILTSAATPHVIRLSSTTASTEVAQMTQREKVAAAFLKAGIVNPEAWAAAGINDPAVSHEATSVDSATANSAAEFETHPRTFLTKGKNPNFLISWRSQRDVANSLGWKCMLLIWGSPAIALISLWGLLAIANVV
jgi:hypothetical protein